MTIRFRPSLCLPLLAVSTLCYGQAAPAPRNITLVSVTRVDVVRMLRARAFERLDQTIAGLQEIVERDLRKEPVLVRAISAFSSADPTLTPLIDAWVKERPSSYAALLGRAEHFEALAWAARGSDWAERTSDEQREAMGRHFGRVVLDAEAAIRLNPRLTLSIAHLISAARATRGPEECALVFDRFYKQVGASIEPRLDLAKCLLPRWGGSYRALETLAEEAAGFQDANPRLAVLRGMVAWDRAVSLSDAYGPEALRLYTDAIGHGDHPPFLLSRARAYLDKRRFADAMQDIERALTLEPEHTEALMLRAWIRNDMGRASEAAADVRLVTEIDPQNEILAEFREREIDDAFETANESTSEGNPEAAILRLNDAITLVGEDSDLLYSRGRAKLRLKDKSGALTDLQQAARLDPHHFDAIRNIDAILVERGQYLDAVRLWDGYLALEPANGKALLARAKAYIGRGDIKPGKADAAAACAAGQQEGCLLIATLP